MPIKDFSERTGKRLRIVPFVYKDDIRNFRAIPGVAALVNVENDREEKRLWKAIEDAIASGSWRDGASSVPDRADHAARRA